MPSKKSNPGNAGKLPHGPGKIMIFMAIVLHAEIKLYKVVRGKPFFGGGGG